MELNSDKIQCCSEAINYLQQKGVFLPEMTHDKVKLILLLMQTWQTQIKYEKVTYYLQKEGVNID